MKNSKLGVAGVISLVFAGLNAVGLLITASWSLLLRQQFMEMFADIGVSLPVLTQIYLSIHWMVWVIITLLLLVILLAKELIPNKWITLIINGVFVIIGIAYWTIFFIAMMLPLSRLLQQMEGG